MNILSNWYEQVNIRNIDLTIVILVIILVNIGICAVFTSTSFSEIPKVQNMIFHHMIFLFISICICICIACTTPHIAYQISYIITAIMVILLVLTPLIGVRINGAIRWLDFGIIRLQPIEIAKPFLFVTLSMLMHGNMMCLMFSLLLAFLVVAFLMLQPDFGQSAVIIIGYVIMLISVSHIKKKYIAIGVVLSMCILIAIYLQFDYFVHRVMQFLYNKNYQLNQAIHAFQNGSWFGTGAGFGIFKSKIQYGYNDFIFAVIAEEYGFVACMVIIIIFFILSIRPILILINNSHALTLTLGLVSLYFLQANIHMMSNMGMIPTKGMSLPFIGYGGSNMLSSFISIGLILMLIRDYRNSLSKKNIASTYSSMRNLWMKI